jgi:hypothetical protein
MVMPQVNLSEANVPELRRLFYASRHRGDTALHQAVVRELRARGAQPPEPWTVEGPSDPGAGAQARPPGAAAAPASEGFVPVDPQMRLSPGLEVRQPRPARSPPFARGGADAGPGAAPDPRAGAFDAEPMGPQAATSPPAARIPQPAMMALFGALTLAVGGVAGWLAHEGMARHPAVASAPPAAVAPDFAAARSASADRADGAAGPAPVTQGAAAAGASAPADPLETSAAPAAAQPRRGLVIVQTPAPLAAAPAAPIRSGVSERPLPLAPEPAPAPMQRTYGSAPQGAPVRVFVHITDAAQTPDVDRVRSQLSALSIAGQPVGMPPVRLVQNGPRRTEVRCLKRSDCAAASRIARSLTQGLGRPVAVVDLSRTYEDDRSVRPGSLELWLGSASGRLAGASVRPARVRARRLPAPSLY